MCRVWKYIIVVFLLHFSAAISAQDEYYPDTVVPVEPPPPQEESSKFSSITQINPVDIKKLDKQQIEDLKNTDAYWYANREPEKKKEEIPVDRNDGLLDQQWFRNLLWIAILCSFVAVVVWYLASSNARLFRKESKKIMEEEARDELAEDIFSINYEREIKKATAAGEYRLAIRLWYLRTLKELSNKNIIAYSHERTNNDYVNSLAGGRHYRDFFRLTRNFEYTWYGQFNLSAEGYEMMQKDFVNFKNSLA